MFGKEAMALSAKIAVGGTVCAFAIATTSELVERVREKKKKKKKKKKKSMDEWKHDVFFSYVWAWWYNGTSFCSQSSGDR